MNLIQLALRNIRFRSLQSAISIFLFAFGVMLISLIAKINQQITNKFENNLAGINLVIGAKGSPLQMILCNMYHIDAPTGNISVANAKPFFNPKHPLIEAATPLSLGDNHQGYRIVGTDQSFFDLYNLQLVQGHMWDHTMEVILGDQVSKALGLRLGDTFFSGHGLIHDDDNLHDDGSPFVVVGILEKSESVVDQLILTATPSVWHVHDHGENHETHSDDASTAESDNHDHDHDAHAQDDSHSHDHSSHDDHDHSGHDHGHDHHHHHSTGEPLDGFNLVDHADEEITSILVKFKGRNFQTLNMQRNINENTDLQAATPAIEVNRVFNLLGFGFDLLKYLAIAIMLVSGISVFLSLLSSLQSRIPELALQRAIGGQRSFLFGQITCEGLLLGLIGAVLGLVLALVAMYFVGQSMAEQYKYSFSTFNLTKTDFYILLASCLIGIVAAIVPAFRAYRTEIAENV